VLKKERLKSATFVDALYSSVLALSTVDYRDSSPVTLHSKLFTTVYILVGIGFISFKLGEIIGNICADIEDLLVRKRNKGLLTFIGWTIFFLCEYICHSRIRWKRIKKSTAGKWSASGWFLTGTIAAVNVSLI
jgi:hypothetical protein